MVNPKQSMDQRLFDARIVIDNSIENAVILEAVTLFGYDLIRLQAARALYDEVIDLVAAQKREYGEQYEATALLQTAWDNADLVYRRALKVSRAVFDGNEKARNTLGLDGSRKFSLSGWMEQALFFYKGLLETPDLLAAITPYSYDLIKVQAESDLVLAVVNAKKVQDAERAEAQHATKVRDAKMDELDVWLARYKPIAEVALDDTPQLLETLGWVVPS